MTRQTRTFSTDVHKQENLILYLSQKCAAQHDFGKTKLCKLLYFSDFLYFAEHKVPITGCDYIRMPYGPYPDGFQDLLDSMESAGKIALQKFPYVQNENQEKPVNLVDPDLTLFSAHEISMIEHVVGTYSLASGTTLSNYSHRLGWKFARDLEVIPYESIFIDTRPITEEETIRGQEIAAQYGYSI